MRILVVDDEPIVLDSICLILSKEPDLQVETARTGREGIEKAELFHPELVMMDIKMPGINGLEALEEIRHLDPQAVLVILSAYENFAYAQEAIHLNVYDYMTKPLYRAPMLELVEKVRQYLARLRGTRQEELALRERYKKLLPLIENEFMQQLIDGLDEADLAKYRESLDLNFTAGFFLAFSHRGVETADDNLTELSRFSRRKMADLAHTIRHLLPCFVGQSKADPIPVLVPVHAGDEPVPSPRDIAAKVLAQLQTMDKPAGIRVGIGRIYPFSPELKRSHQEALRALQENRHQTIVFYGDSKPAEDYGWEHHLEQDLQDILQMMRFGNLQKVQTAFGRIIPKYADRTGDIDRLSFHLLEFLMTAYRVVKENSGNINHPFPSFEQTIAIFNRVDNPGAFFNKTAERIMDLTRVVQEGRDDQVKSVIRRAKAIIDDRFDQPITLEEIAHAVGISPFYFCRLFREELGISFNKYVTGLRMEQAIKMLAQGLSVKECCFSVGYNDPNYFSRIFKKYFYMAPSEYKERQEWLKGASD